MKKLLFLILAITAVHSGWGQALDQSDWYVTDIDFLSLPFPLNTPGATQLAIGGNFKGKTVYLFAGFDGIGYRKNGPDLPKMNKAEVAAIKNGIPLRVTKTSGPYSIIGYSQGGLRVLGYISELKKQNGNLNNIDAVITIAGIDNGLKALEGGLGNFKSRASEKINIYGNGLRAASGLFDIFGILDKVIPRNQSANGLSFFSYIVPQIFRPYFTEAWADPSSKAIQAIHDMSPRGPYSTYIKDNVSESRVHSYKKKAGTEIATEWRYKTIWPGIKVYYLWVGTVDVYKWYEVTEIIPKFDATVPVGFIVGLNSNTLSMSELAEPLLRAQIGLAGAGFVTVEGLHIAKSVFTLGLASGSATYAKDAKVAANLMFNFDAALNDIKRSTQNDGLVALESQYIPKTFTDPNTKVTRTNLKNPVLLGGSLGYEKLSAYNHKNIAEKPDTFRIARQMVDAGTKERIRQGLPR